MKLLDFAKITACGECCDGCGKKAGGFCEGCIESDGYCAEWAGSGRCPIHKCARKHGVRFCGLCSEFPCDWLPKKVSWNKNIAEDLTMLRDKYYNQVFNKARTFIYRNARPLDLAKWRYHFEGGSKEAVLTALAAYQNEDGGFGHALEPDCWNPNSSPIQTWEATEILKEIDFTDKLHPIIQGILRYLASGQDFNGGFWHNTIRSNNDYPHAPWWHTESDSSCHNDYNPTACLAGFIVRFADHDSELFRLGRRIASEAYNSYISQGLLNDMHTAGCYIRLMEYCEQAGADEIFDAEILKTKLRDQVKNSITKNTAEWETGYICKPSQFFNSRGSIFYTDNKDIAEYECEFIIKTQLEDGSWPIPWGWGDYPEQWAVSKNWWKAMGCVGNMLYLRGMGKISDI